MGKITNEKLQQLRDTFKQYDENGDNQIDKSELIKVLEHFHIANPEKEAESMIAKFDSDKDGGLSFAEFSRVHATKLLEALEGEESSTNLRSSTTSSHNTPTLRSSISSPSTQSTPPPTRHTPPPPTQHTCPPPPTQVVPSTNAKLFDWNPMAKEGKRKLKDYSHVPGLTMKGDSEGFTYQNQEKRCAVFTTLEWKKDEKAKNSLDYFEVTYTAERPIIFGFADDESSTDTDDKIQIEGNKSGTTGFGLKQSSGDLFITENGQFSRWAVGAKFKEKALKPVIRAYSCEVTLNFGGPYKFNVSTLPVMIPAYSFKLAAKWVFKDVLALVCDDIVVLNTVKKIVEEVATDNKTDIQFCFDQKGLALSKLRGPHFPKHPVLILQSRLGDFFVKDVDVNFDTKSVREFIQKYKDGKLKPFVPPTNNSTVSFKEIVINNNRDVVVFFLNRGATEDEKRFAMTECLLIEEVLANQSHLVVAKFEYDSKLEDEASYMAKKYSVNTAMPVQAVMFPANNKRVPLRHDSNLMEGLLNFIHEHADITFDMQKATARLLLRYQLLELVASGMVVPKAQFSEGTPVFPSGVTLPSHGWLAHPEKAGALLVEKSTPTSYIVYFPSKQVYGVLEGDRVKYSKEGKPHNASVSDTLSEMCFQYGNPAVGKDLVWLPAMFYVRTRAPPSVFVGKKGATHPSTLLARMQDANGKHYVGTAIFANAAIIAEFLTDEGVQYKWEGFEILACRIINSVDNTKWWSLTNSEFEYISSQLTDSVSAALTMLLSIGVSKEQFQKCEDEFLSFVIALLDNFPIEHTHSNKICNKLLQLFGSHFTPHTSVSSVQNSALNLRARIQNTYEHIMEALLGCIDKKGLQERVSVVAKNISRPELLNQVALVHLPPWYHPKQSPDRKVHTFVIIVLYFLGGEFSEDLLKYYTATIESKEDSLGLGKILNMTYSELLPRAYIKVATLLRPTLQQKLLSLFPSEDVLIAPIKDIKRCVVKMEEFFREGKPRPSASFILDYLRATILCESIEAAITALENISKTFEVVRVKDRLLGENSANKALLVNIIVRDPTLRPKTHEMFQPGWWEDGKTVEMICEVQIAVRQIFYLDKQFHAAYEIARCNSCEEWSSSLDSDPTYHASEQNDFPLGLLYGSPDFAF